MITLDDDSRLVDSSYSVKEDDGAVPQITYDLEGVKDSFLLYGREIVLSDDTRGKIRGVITDVDDQDGEVSVTADSILGKFNIFRVIPPFYGTMQRYFATLMALCGITASDATLRMDANIQNRSVVMNGYNDNVWTHIVNLLDANDWEIAQVNENIVVRGKRQLTSPVDRFTAPLTTHYNSQSSALSVIVHYYPTQWVTKHQFIPILPDTSATNEDSDTDTATTDVWPVPGTESIISVNSGQSTYTAYSVHGTLTSVNQPTAADYVSMYYSANGTNGRYSVIDGDSKPVSAHDWLANGGFVRVQISSDDPSQIIVETHGRTGGKGPYSIAAKAGNDSYSTLHVTGTGTTYADHSLTIYTGAPLNATGTEVGTELEDVSIQTAAQAYTRGRHLAATYSGSLATLSGEAVSLNRASNDATAEKRSQVSDFDIKFGGYSVSSFDSWASGYTLAEFDSWWSSQLETIFANQAFGQAIGARLPTPNAMYRITSVTTGPVKVSFEAEVDTLISDFDSAHGDMTVADFDSTFSGLRAMDFQNVPLRNGALD